MFKCEIEDCLENIQPDNINGNLANCAGFFFFKFLSLWHPHIFSRGPSSSQNSSKNSFYHYLLQSLVNCPKLCSLKGWGILDIYYSLKGPEIFAQFFFYFRLIPPKHVYVIIRPSRYRYSFVHYFRWVWFFPLISPKFVQLCKIVFFLLDFNKSHVSSLCRRSWHSTDSSFFIICEFSFAIVLPVKATRAKVEN